MNELAIQYKAASSLSPYSNNSRTHSAEQIQQIATSIREFGFTNPILIDPDDNIIAGHGRLAAAKTMKLDQVPCIVLHGLDDAQRQAYVIADNQLALNADWDLATLKAEVERLCDLDFNTDLLGFDGKFLEQLLETTVDPLEIIDDPQVDPDAPIVSKVGDVWLLGDHRVMCGDSTSVDDVAKLMGGKTAALLHADPPYGMGKAKDGVLNDNLYNEKLDSFQMEWWATFRTFLDDNASAYIWGNAPDLWRLWYAGGLGDSENLIVRNEIVWDKKTIPGMKSDLMHQYPEATERCLYIQIGNQFLGNINSDDFPDEWQPILDCMKAKADAAGLTPRQLKEICGVAMYGHWFSTSQFTLIPEKHYQTLQQAFPAQFDQPWHEIKTEWDQTRGTRSMLNAEFTKGRSYFDNGHDIMRDVWEFDRVVGDERHDHATPKPVAMMQRCMKSSLPLGGLCVEPFGGSGATLMGAASCGRVCYTMELQERYVDTIVRRWQEFSGKDALLESTGETFDGLAEQTHD